MCYCFGITTNTHVVALKPEVNERDLSVVDRRSCTCPQVESAPSSDVAQRRQRQEGSGSFVVVVKQEEAARPRAVTMSGLSEPDAWRPESGRKRRHRLTLHPARLLAKRKEGRSWREAQVTAGECELTKPFRKVAPLTRRRPLRAAGRSEPGPGNEASDTRPGISQRDGSSRPPPPSLPGASAAGMMLRSG